MISKISKLLSFKPKSLKYIQGSYSQFGEDFFLRYYFANCRNGNYIDVGAFHPYRFSNTQYLRTQLGWSGINVEPQPENHALLEQETDDININCVVSDAKGKVDFKVDGVCSSITEDKGGANVISVESRRLDDIIKESGVTDLRFMSVDCEGYDIEVLKTNNWELYRPDIIAVEDHERALGTKVDEFMATIGYQMISWHTLTKFYVDKQKKD